MTSSQMIRFAHVDIGYIHLEELTENLKNHIYLDPYFYIHLMLH